MPTVIKDVFFVKKMLTFMSLTNYTLGGDRLISLEHTGSGVRGQHPLA